MKNIFLFSDFIKPNPKKIKFLFIVIKRFFKILFRRRKDIKLLQLEYANNYQFDNSYLIIRYRFRNVLWYDFKNIKKTTGKDIIILNFKNVPKMPIELVIYGFFRKKVIPILVVAENTIKTKLFNTEMKDLKKLKSFIKPLELNNQKPTVVIPRISLKTPNIQIKHSTFSQIDFI